MDCLLILMWISVKKVVSRNWASSSWTLALIVVEMVASRYLTVVV